MRESPAPSEVLKVFHDNPGKTFRLRELVVELGLRSSQARELKRVLKDLARNRKVVYHKKNHFGLAQGASGREAHSSTGPRPASSYAPAGPAPGRRNTVTGRLIGHRDGYGFVPIEVKSEDEATEHAANERVPVEQIRRGVKMFCDVVMRAANEP